jgi:riboflavin kinase/FMN adenylyltransferase
MEFVRGIVNLRPRQRGCVLTIGAFDGLHLGHQALIRRSSELAARAARRSMLLTFEPLPRQVLTPAAAPARLTNFRERWRLLEAMGLDTLMVLQFNEKLRQVRGEDFAVWLSRELQAYAVVIGHDFRLGRSGEMSAGMLEEAGRRLGFGVEIIPPVLQDGARVSSSALREALTAAEFARAARMLGRPYRMRGRVVHGKALGRTLGFPTANVRLQRRHCPFTGIYAVRALGVSAAPLPGVASLGTRPTVGGGELLLETNIFDYNGDLYGRELEIEFVAKLREELRFASLDELVVQMRRDSIEARAILAA